MDLIKLNNIALNIIEINKETFDSLSEKEKDHVLVLKKIDKNSPLQLNLINFEFI